MSTLALNTAIVASPNQEHHGDQRRAIGQGACPANAIPGYHNKHRSQRGSVYTALDMNRLTSTFILAWGDCSSDHATLNCRLTQAHVRPRARNENSPATL